MTWYEAAHYCDWLSEQEKIPKEQWCYDPKGGAYGPGMKAKEQVLGIDGLSVAHGGGMGICVSRGNGDEPLLRADREAVTAICMVSGQRRKPRMAHGWSRMEPNDFGLFDMLGNALEWCFDRFGGYPEQKDKVFEDTPSTQPVEAAESRVLRGGSFNNQPSNVRSAYRSSHPPDDRNLILGFRPARTYP